MFIILFMLKVPFKLQLT